MTMIRSDPTPWSNPALRRGSAWLNRILFLVTRPQHAALIFGLGILLVYCVIPLSLSMTGYPDPAYRTLAAMAALGTIVMWGTYALARGAVISVPKIGIDQDLFLIVVIGIFAAFVVLSWATAEQIPLIAALQGADPDTVAALRESFLKARGGWQSSFVYVNAILSGALLPYCIALLFIRDSRYKWWVFGFFMLYSISFVEKAFFLKAVIPVFYLLCQGIFRSRLQPSVIAAGSVLLLFAFTVLSRLGDTGWHIGGGDFWAPTYQPGNALDQLAWRTFSVPMFSAIDSIKLWETSFNYPLGGATSSLVSSAFGLHRVEFERLVFAYEWGQNAAGTGSTNSVYVIEAFVNFGWAGVAIFSAVVGLMFRVFAQSEDEAFRALWLMFCINLFAAGLIGLVFSNGFLLVFLIAIFARMGRVPKSVAAVAPARVPAANRIVMPWERKF